MKQRTVAAIVSFSLGVLVISWLPKLGLAIRRGEMRASTSGSRPFVRAEGVDLPVESEL